MGRMSHRAALLSVLFAGGLCAAGEIVRLEEPTGIERRYNEVIAIPASAPARVTGPDGKPVPTQFTGSELLFAASLVPGTLPAYQIIAAPAGKNDSGEIVARKIGLNRVELANSRFRIVVDLAQAAIVEAYNLSAGPQRVLNSVETTPPDGGWSTTVTGAISRVDFLETGPLRARIRFIRPNDQWDIEFTAQSPTLRWRARAPFRFHAVSAAPFVPYDRFVTGDETNWPDGPDDTEPPDHEIAPHNTRSGVYYNAAENYGAFGVAAASDVQRLGTARFDIQSPGEVLLIFPRWSGRKTALDFRRELRIARNPVLKLGSDFVHPKTPGPELAARLARLAGDEWLLAWGEKGAGPSSEWRPVRVPGAAQTQWLPQADWYTRRAEWVSNKEWWYRKRLAAPSRQAGDRVRLQFEATDYYADAWFNGHYLGRHEGYIDPYEYDVTAQLKPENEILVRVWTPVTYYWRHRPYTIKGSYGAVDQKPDDITPLGITRPVRLIATNPISIKDVAVATPLHDDGSATVAVDIETTRPARVRLTLTPKNFEGRPVIVTGVTPHVEIRLRNPRLWWTWDHGQPNLYNLQVDLIGDRVRPYDSKTLTIGIREIEKIGWTFYLNRHRMFIRGTNYYYGNLYLPLMDRPAYERDLKLMLGMNVNLIRLHCHFANPEFYELADAAGVLLWQDYLEAWYPDDRQFSLRAAALYDNHIRYVRNHPSVALWATSDEEGLENYTELTKHLAPRLALLDPQRRPVVRSTGRYGDAHVYHGWYDGKVSDYAGMDEEFVSELGATALPNYDSLQKFLPDAWPIEPHAADWIFHKLQIPEAMRAWGPPGNRPIPEYISHTQEYVAQLFQLALERARVKRYDRFGGILHFHAIDFWPSVTMAASDYYRQPTAAYETVRRSFALVGVVFEQKVESGRLFPSALWVVNDSWNPIKSTLVEWWFEDENGHRVGEGAKTLDVEADSSQRLELKFPGEANIKKYRLLANLKIGGRMVSSNHVTGLGKSASN